MNNLSKKLISTMLTYFFGTILLYAAGPGGLDGIILSACGIKYFIGSIWVKTVLQ
jgi:hypothetical protein